MSGPRRRARSRGSGTAYLRADGRWMAQVFVTESVTGRRVRRAVYGKTEDEVETKLRELRDRESQGAPIAPAALTLERYLREWLSQIVSVRVRANTLAHYKFQVDKYLAPDLGKKSLGRLTAREVRMYLEQLRKRGAGPRTVQYVHATLRAALEDAVREEIIPRNVAKLVRVPAPPKTEREPLTVNEVRTLLKSSRDHRLYAMFVVFAVLGMRRSEVLGLRWEDVDLSDGYLQVRRGLQRIDGELKVLPTKTARSRRTVPLPDFVVRAFKAHLAAQERERSQLGAHWPDLGYVFTTKIGTPIDPRNCTRVVQEACKLAGLRVVRLHDFRHGCVSVLLALGVPPRTTMDIVGHSTIEMTMNVYGHVSLTDKRAAMDQLGKLLDEDGE
jgi:integrase